MFVDSSNVLLSVPSVLYSSDGIGCRMSLLLQISPKESAHKHPLPKTGPWWLAHLIICYRFGISFWCSPSAARTDSSTHWSTLINNEDQFNVFYLVVIIHRLFNLLFFFNYSTLLTLSEIPVDLCQWRTPPVLILLLQSLFLLRLPTVVTVSTESLPELSTN